MLLCETTPLLLIWANGNLKNTKQIINLTINELNQYTCKTEKGCIETQYDAIWFL